MLFIKCVLVQMRSWTADTKIQSPHLSNGSKTSVIGNNCSGGRSTQLKFQTFSIKRPEWRCRTSPRPHRLNAGSLDWRLRLQCACDCWTGQMEEILSWVYPRRAWAEQPIKNNRKRGRQNIIIGPTVQSAIQRLASWRFAAGGGCNISDVAVMAYLTLAEDTDRRRQRQQP